MKLKWFFPGRTRVVILSDGYCRGCRVSATSTVALTIPPTRHVGTVDHESTGAEGDRDAQILVFLDFPLNQAGKVVLIDLVLRAN